MKILHVLFSRLSLPPVDYGGTERVIWSLYKAQQRQGHEVRFLWRNVKHLPPNAAVYDKNRPLEEQIGQWPDVVHFHWPYDGPLEIPHVNTEHSNADRPKTYPINTIFLSQKHADNHGAICFVHNGLDWDEYGDPNLDNPKDYFHFLAKSKLKTKNLKGTVEIARKARINLNILGGNRFEIGDLRLSRPSLSGIYFYPERFLTFHGKVGGKIKLKLIRDSKGLIFPVRWHEPFGLAIIESLFLGTPVFGTPYGSLPEIVASDDVGFLSNQYQDLADAITNLERFNRKSCHELARDMFNADRMAEGYDRCYEKVINGYTLNKVKPQVFRPFPALLPVN